MTMTNLVGEQRKSVEKNSVDTITGCWNQLVGKARNHPPHLANNRNESLVVRGEVEAVHQQWADDGQ